MGWLIVVGTVPIAVLGVLAKDAIEGALRNLYVTATMLSVFGVLLGLADRWGTRRRTLTELSWGDGILLGLAQALALVPGVSRSGGTITAGLLLGFGREACARYSFLLAVPAVLASGFYQLARHWREFATVAALPTAVATLTAFATGYAVIVVFLRVVSRHGYLGFVIYRVALGALVLAGLATGTMAAA